MASTSTQFYGQGAFDCVCLFCGLRADEIQRLRVGCTRENWNRDVPSAQAAPPCAIWTFRSITSQAFTKPVDEIVGDSIRAWEAERPEQLPTIDEKTGEWRITG